MTLDELNNMTNEELGAIVREMLLDGANYVLRAETAGAPKRAGYRFE
jgi:hypothetical protein